MPGTVEPLFFEKEFCSVFSSIIDDDLLAGVYSNTLHRERVVRNGKSRSQRKGASCALDKTPDSSQSPLNERSGQCAEGTFLNEQCLFVFRRR